MDAQFYGVLVAVSETSAKLSCKQDQFIQVLITQCLLYYICLSLSHSSSWIQPVLSNEGKVSCSRIEQEPSIELETTTDRHSTDYESDAQTLRHTAPKLHLKLCILLRILTLLLCFVDLYCFLHLPPSPNPANKVLGRYKRITLSIYVSHKGDDYLCGTVGLCYLTHSSRHVSFMLKELYSK